MARGRSRANQILALHAAGGRQLHAVRRSGQAALAHRARLSGTQAGGRLGHYEGRGWRGFHHHATLCIAAYGFLIAEQATIPPSGPRSVAPVQVTPLPDNYRPRGSTLAA